MRSVGSGPETSTTARGVRIAVAAGLAILIPVAWWGAGALWSGDALFGRYSRPAFLAALAATFGLLWGVYAALGRGTLREKAVHGLLSACSVLFVLGVLELPALLGWIDYGKIVSPPESVLFTRVKPWQRPSSRYDPELLFIHRPGLHFRGETLGDLVGWLRIATSRRYTVDVRYDSNGFRNERDLRAAPIVAIGDSFVEAGLVASEELVTTRLARTFDVDVANLGQGAYGPQQELIVLRRYGMPLRPSVVLWFFFEGNDLLDVHRFVDFQNDPSKGLRPSPTFADRSLARNALRTLEWISTPTLERDSPEAVRRSCRLRSRDETIYFAYAGEPVTPRDEAALEVVHASLLEARRLAEDGGARFLLVYVPTKFRVYREECVFPADGYGRIWQPNDLPPRIATWARQNGIAYLDTTPALAAAAARGELVHFADDGHWNGEAHRVAAEAIAESLRREGWDDEIRRASATAGNLIHRP